MPKVSEFKGYPQVSYSDELIGMIKEFEGFRRDAYQDAAGHWTVGYGQKDGVTAGMSMTEDEASMVLVARVNRDMRLINEWFGDHDLVPTMQMMDALLSFTYNFSPNRLFSSTFGKYILDKKPFPEIEKKWMQWVHARVNGQMTVLSGLKKRRRWECSRFLQGWDEFINPPARTPEIAQEVEAMSFEQKQELARDISTNAVIAYGTMSPGEWEQLKKVGIWDTHPAYVAALAALQSPLRESLQTLAEQIRRNNNISNTQRY